MKYYAAVEIPWYGKRQVKLRGWLNGLLKFHGLPEVPEFFELDQTNLRSLQTPGIMNPNKLARLQKARVGTVIDCGKACRGANRGIKVLDENDPVIVNWKAANDLADQAAKIRKQLAKDPLYKKLKKLEADMSKLRKKKPEYL